MALVKGDQSGKVKASALGVLVRIAETEAPWRSLPPAPRRWG